MKAYKFISSEYAEDAVRLGKVRISLLSHFHSIEDAEIRDEQDGVSVGSLSPVTLHGSDPCTADIRKRLEKNRFIKIGEGSSVTIGDGVTFSLTLPPIYILSLSLNKNCRKWLESEKRKDAVITIKHVRIVGKLVAEKHSEVLGKPTFGRVRYYQKRTDLQNQDLPEPDPFLKRPNFSEEDEYRIIFPAKQYDQKWFDTDCPEVCDFLSWQYR